LAPAGPPRRVSSATVRKGMARHTAAQRRVRPSARGCPELLRAAPRLCAVRARSRSRCRVYLFGKLVSLTYLLRRFVTRPRLPSPTFRGSGAAVRSAARVCVSNMRGRLLVALILPLSAALQLPTLNGGRRAVAPPPPPPQAPPAESALQYSCAIGWLGLSAPSLTAARPLVNDVFGLSQTTFEQCVREPAGGSEVPQTLS
jgi:hypothetical protein